jgi:acetyl esterase/lipase
VSLPQTYQTFNSKLQILTQSSALASKEVASATRSIYSRLQLGPLQIDSSYQDPLRRRLCRRKPRRPLPPLPPRPHLNRSPSSDRPPFPMRRYDFVSNAIHNPNQVRLHVCILRYCALHDRYSETPRTSVRYTEISVLLAKDVGGLPPQLMYYSTTEVLASDAKQWIERSREAGVEIVEHKVTGHLHTYGLGWPFVGKALERKCDELLIDFIFSHV